MTAIDPLMTSQEVADVLRVDRSTVTRLAQARLLKGLQVGLQASAWRFRRSDVEAFITRSMNCGKPETAVQEHDARRRQAGRPIGTTVPKAPKAAEAPGQERDDRVH